DGDDLRGGTGGVCERRPALAPDAIGDVAREPGGGVPAAGGAVGAFARAHQRRRFGCRPAPYLLPEDLVGRGGVVEAVAHAHRVGRIRAASGFFRVDRLEGDRVRGRFLERAGKFRRRRRHAAQAAGEAVERVTRVIL